MTRSSATHPSDRAPDGSASGTSAELLVVVDIGGTKTRIGHLRRGVPGTRFDTFDSRLLDTGTPHAVLAREIEAHLSSCASASASPSAMASPVPTHAPASPSAIVIGIPGMIDRARDLIGSCNNVPSLHGSHLRSGLADALGCGVLLEQDIMLQLLGEWRAGVARGREAVFGIYFGTGIGSAWLRHGDPTRAGAASLQAGHVPIAGEGRACPCGNLDCVEAYASGHVLRALSLEYGVPLGELFVRTGPAGLRAALERFVTYQAFLLATVTTLMQPDLIVVGGGVPAMQGYPRERLLEIAVRHLQRPKPAPADRFAFAALDERASLHGALALLDRVPFPARPPS